MKAVPETGCAARIAVRCEAGPGIRGGLAEAKDNPAGFAANVRFWRRAKQISIKQASGRLGVARSTWCQWELGERAPSVANIYLLCRVLGIDACGLFSANPQKCLTCPRQAG